jgi:hypothetical protein
LDLTCVLEYKENWILSADKGPLEAAFGSVLIAMVQVDFFENRLSSVVTWVEFLNDHSRVLEFRLCYQPSLELEIAPSAPCLALLISLFISTVLFVILGIPYRIVGEAEGAIEYVPCPGR